jgi:hypothetical protein
MADEHERRRIINVVVYAVGYEPVSTRNREFFENFRLKQAFGGPSALGHRKIA